MIREKVVHLFWSGNFLFFDHCTVQVDEHALEMHHIKTGLKIFVPIIITKEGLVGTSPSKPSFGMTQIIEWLSVVFTIYIL